MSKLKTILIFALLCFALQLQAQQRTIQSTVTDNTGFPIPGVNILIKVSNVCSTTNSDGYYQITINEEVTLIYSMTGFQDQEISTNGRSRIDVELVEESMTLGEVVVMGYNEVERRHLASS